MTFKQAKRLANKRLGKANTPGALVAYKDLGDSYVFFASRTKELDGPLGDKVIEVKKDSGTATWQSVFSFGRPFLVSPTIDIPREGDKSDEESKEP